MRHEAIGTATTYSREGRVNAFEQLVAEHRTLVRRIAWHVHSRMSNTIDIEELMQVGMVALIEAGRQFEDRGLPFAPYAATRIRGSMIDELRRAAKIGRAAIAGRKRLAEARGKLEHRHMRPPTDIEMAEEMGLSIAAYHDLAASAQDVEHVSMEDSYSDSSAFFADDEDGPDIATEKSQMTALLATNISRLGEREALILNLYFVEEMNLHEIGETMSLTPARICQIKAKALDRLREWMVTDAD